MSEDENEEVEKKNKKQSFKLVIFAVVIIAIVELVYGGYMLYEKYKPKFKNVELEIGTVDSVTMQDFLIDKKYEENSKLITSLEDIDFSKIGEYKVILSHDDKKEEVTLRLVDTTSPKVEFQDISRYIDYKINAEDFIITKEDLSEMEAYIVDIPDINKFGDYAITVVVKDSSDNKTSKVCNLSIQWIKDSFSIERGQELRKEDLLYDAEVDGNLLDIDRLKEISNSDIGEYEIITTKDGIQKKTIIKVTDLTPPTLEVKDITMYDDDTINGKDSFIVSTYDASGDVTTTLKSELDYTKIGVQDVVIEAVDKYGNKTEKTVKLTIKKDTTGPVFMDYQT